MGQCAITILTPVMCVGGSCGACCLECCRTQMKSAGGLYRGELKCSAAMLAIGILLFIFVSYSCGGVDFVGGDGNECWSTQTSKLFLPGFLCAVCIGLGAPMFMQSILRLYVAPPSSVDYTEQGEELVDEEGSEEGR